MRILILLLICGTASAGPYIGDYTAGETICGYFNTYQPSTGASFTLASGAAQAFKDGSATQDTSGITLDNDFDSITGYHQVCVDTSADGAFFTDGARYSINLSAGTVDSVSVVGTEVFSFSLLDGSLAELGTLLDGRDVGLNFSGTIATVNSQVSLDLSGGATNDDAYKNSLACIVGGTEEGCERITNYVASSNTITLENAMPFTVATSDVIRIYEPTVAVVRDVVSADAVQISGSPQAADRVEENTAGSIYTLDALLTAIGNIEVEDQGAGYSLKCAVAIILASASGEWTDDGSTGTFQDPSGTEDRIEGDHASGSRGPMTLTCP